MVGALQETKWFCNEVYEADSVVLLSGRGTPCKMAKERELLWCSGVLPWTLGSEVGVMESMESSVCYGTFATG